MLKLLVQIHLTMLFVDDLARTRSAPTRDERGSVTIEHVLWAVAVLAIVGVVVAAVKAYVATQAGNLK
jgi:hypothetical protein